MRCKTLPQLLIPCEMHGEGKTTLAPVVQTHSPEGNVICPDGTVDGKVRADTESFDLTAATDIIEISANRPQ